MLSAFVSSRAADIEKEEKIKKEMADNEKKQKELMDQLQKMREAEDHQRQVSSLFSAFKNNSDSDSENEDDDRPSMEKALRKLKKKEK